MLSHLFNATRGWDMKNQRRQSEKISWWQRLLFPQRLPGLFAARLRSPLAGMQSATPDAPRAQARIHRKAEGHGRVCCA